MSARFALRKRELICRIEPITPATYGNPSGTFDKAAFRKEERKNDRLNLNERDELLFPDYLRGNPFSRLTTLLE